MADRKKISIDKSRELVRAGSGDYEVTGISNNSHLHIMGESDVLISGPMFPGSELKIARGLITIDKNSECVGKVTCKSGKIILDVGCHILEDAHLTAPRIVVAPHVVIETPNLTCHELVFLREGKINRGFYTEGTTPFTVILEGWNTIEPGEKTGNPTVLEAGRDFRIGPEVKFGKPGSDSEKIIVMSRANIFADEVDFTDVSVLAGFYVSARSFTDCFVEITDRTDLNHFVHARTAEKSKIINVNGLVIIDDIGKESEVTAEEVRAKTIGGGTFIRTINLTAEAIGTAEIVAEGELIIDNIGAYAKIKADVVRVEKIHKDAEVEARKIYIGKKLVEGNSWPVDQKQRLD